MSDRFCVNCGAKLQPGYEFCSQCGHKNPAGESAGQTPSTKTCPKCAAELSDKIVIWPRCGYDFGQTQNAARGETAYGPYQGSANYGQIAKPPRSRLVAGLLGILIGGLGIHNFYLGFTTKGVIQIVLTVLTCGIAALWGFIEGILILCNQINVDADGNPLQD